MCTRAYIHAFNALLIAWIIVICLAVKDMMKYKRFPDFDLVFAAIGIPILLYILFMLIRLDYSMC